MCHNGDTSRAGIALAGWQAGAPQRLTHQCARVTADSRVCCSSVAKAKALAPPPPHPPGQLSSVDANPLAALAARWAGIGAGKHWLGCPMGGHRGGEALAGLPDGRASGWGSTHMKHHVLLAWWVKACPPQHRLEHTSLP
jgi:hypothetical protein